MMHAMPTAQISTPTFPSNNFSLNFFGRNGIHLLSGKRTSIPNLLLKSSPPSLNSRSFTLTLIYTFPSACHPWRKKPKTLSSHLLSPLPNRKPTLLCAPYTTSLEIFSNPVQCLLLLAEQIALTILSMALIPQINGNLLPLHKLILPFPPLNRLSLKALPHNLFCTLILLKSGIPKISPNSSPLTFGTRPSTFKLLPSLPPL